MTLPIYVPPADDEPLDEIERRIVEMWIDIIADEIKRQSPKDEEP